jgi:hypothetical protein
VTVVHVAWLLVGIGVLAWGTGSGAVSLYRVRGGRTGRELRVIKRDRRWVKRELARKAAKQDRAVRRLDKVEARRGRAL